MRLLQERRSWIAPLFLVLAILVPYWRLTTMQGIVVTDDRIISDIFDGELPPRVEAARLLHSGHLPVWTPRMCTGYPLIAGGSFPDPLSLATFALFPTVVAVNTFQLATLIAAALGAYALALRIGCSRTGATLSGLAFSWSGYMVCQLKHLGIVSTVCWLPLALVLLDRALSTAEDVPRLRRLARLAPFAAIVALQWVSNFPQSAYICTLVYATFALAYALRHDRRGGAMLLAATAFATVLGIACAAIALLPLRELGAQSTRQGGVPWEFATMLPYSPRDVLTFFVPYANGDISDLTYRGTGLFWENYGYVGFLTACLAILAVVRRVKTFHVALFAIAAVVAYLLVLGPATPFFRLAFVAVPGMKNFRFPTRFLVVVELALAILGGVGLTEIESLVREKRAELAPRLALAIVAVTGVDLVFHQLRQNPIGDAKSWLAPPETAQFLAAQKGHFRIFTPKHREAHTYAWAAAKGWSDIGPYFVHRGLIQPNTNLLWGLSTADCYAGLLPRGTSLGFGEFGLIQQTHGFGAPVVRTSDAFFRMLGLSATRYLLSPWRIETGGAELVAELPPTHVYRIPTLPRAYFTRSAILVESPRAALDAIVGPSFNPSTQVVLEDAGSIAPPPVSTGEREGTVKWLADDATEVVLEATSAAGGWFVLADTWYPGWHAEVDGVEVPYARANGNYRAVALQPGTHRVRWWYRSESVRRGALVSTAAVTLLVALGAWLRVRANRSTMAAA